MHLGIHAVSTPDKPAYIMAGTGETITYRQMEEDSNRIAHLMRSAGIRQGDSIALLMENNPWYFRICWAAQRAGLRFTAISSRLTLGEAEYIVNDCGAKAFFTSKEKAELAAELRPLAPNVVLFAMVDGVIDGYESLEQAVAQLPATPIADEAEGFTMLYSSGTTGRPKGVKVQLSLAPLGEGPSLEGLLRGVYGMTDTSVYLSPAPLYHAAPLRH